MRIVSTLHAEKDCFVKPRDNWHFQDEVYKKQISGIDDNATYRNNSFEHEYTSVLKDSMFSFCPAEQALIQLDYGSQFHFCQYL